MSLFVTADSRAILPGNYVNMLFKNKTMNVVKALVSGFFAILVFNSNYTTYDDPQAAWAAENSILLVQSLEETKTTDLKSGNSRLDQSYNSKEYGSYNGELVSAADIAVVDDDQSMVPRKCGAPIPPMQLPEEDNKAEAASSSLTDKVAKKEVSGNTDNTDLSMVPRKCGAPIPPMEIFTGE